MTNVARPASPGNGAPTREIGLRSMLELLAHPELMTPPAVVVPRLAWQGRVTLFAAREKDGKSTLATAAAAAVSRARYFLGADAAFGNVWWYSADFESPYDVVRRFQDFYAEPTRIWFPEPRPSTLADLYAPIRGSRPQLVVVDTLASAVIDRVRDANSSTEWAGLMLELAAVARESNAAILLLHHASKMTGRYRDSTAIGAGVDAILEMEPAADDPTARLIRARGRWAMQDFRVRFVDGDFVLDDGRPALETRILAHVEAHPGQSGRAIRTAVGGREEEVAAALRRLERESLVVNDGKHRHAAWSRTGAVLPVLPIHPEARGAAVLPTLIEGEAPAVPDEAEDAA